MYQNSTAKFEKDINLILLKYNGLNVQAEEFIPSGKTYILKNGRFHEIS